MKIEGAAMRWLRGATGAPVVALEELRGATSSVLYRVVTADASEYVLRLFTRADWLAREPDLVAHEGAALHAAAEVDIETPRFVASTTEDVGFGAPALLMTRVPGEVWLPQPPSADWLARLAAASASIHRLDASSFRWQYRSWTDPASRRAPEWSRHSAQVWERALEIARGPGPVYTPVLLHRDFHPTNVLWRDGEVSGVVDWVNACRGPAGVDVAHCRSNLAAMYGATAADDFLDAYTALSPSFDWQPYWDIDSLLDWASTGPRFYEPWAHFGLNSIPQDTLRERLDDHLERILVRADGVG